MPKLTVAAVHKYAPQARRREIRDALAPGLYLIVQPKPRGTKSWAMRFRRPDGRPAKLTLGSVDLDEREASDEPVLGGALTLRQARQLANKIDRERARGVDVIAEHDARRHRERAEAARRTASSFGLAAREFFAEYKVKRWGARPRRWREDARLLGLRYPPDRDPTDAEPEVLRGGLADTWGEKPVADITDDDVYAVVDGARRHGVPGMDRRGKGASDARGRKLHGALSVLFRWLLRHRRVRANPCQAVARPGPPPQRERALTEQEVRWLWLACEKVGPPFGPLFKLLLLTGARLAEVTGMRRTELSENGDGASWTVPSERTKNHRAHLVPLAPLARQVIASAPQVQSDAGYVFSYTGKVLSGFSRAKASLDAAMLAVAREEDPEAKLTPWRLHDLRRTVSTMMHDRLGVLPHVVEAVLNHVSGHKAGVAGTYNVAEYRAEKTTALARWAAHVQGVVEQRPANVVSITKRSKQP
jgi:integrase